MNIMVDIPERYLVDSDSAEMARRLKLYTALIMFRSGELSAGAACEFAEIDRYAFLAECTKHGIPVIDYEEEEIDVEMERIGKGIS